MRFVGVKTETSKVISVRSSYTKERTACMSRIGATLLEFGMSFPRGHSKMKVLFQWLADNGEQLPAMLMQELIEHHEYYLLLIERIAGQDKNLNSLSSKMF